MKTKHLMAAALLAGLVWSSAQAQSAAAAKPKITLQEVATNIYMLTGSGGNIGLFVGKDRVLMIDGQFAESASEVKAAIRTVTDKPITYLVNTHWHGDHTGGNAAFAKEDATIIAHDNVRARLSSVQFSRLQNKELQPSPSAALPIITFSTSLHFYIDDVDVLAVHSPASHTDGDTILQFRGVNVIHMGDLFFNGTFPFIDIDAGGSLNGLIAAGGLALARMDRDTKIIPGHGPLATRADFRNYLNMLKRVHRSMKKSIGDKLSLEEVLAADPLARLSEEWGDGFLKTPVFTELAYQLVKAEPKKSKRSRKSKKRRKSR